MTFHPIIPIPVTFLFLIVCGGIIVWGLHRISANKISTGLRRFSLLAVIVFMLIGPQISTNTPQIHADAEFWFVVDTTGSMGAEDWRGENPRLEGVRHDVERIAHVAQRSRFVVYTWDSSTIRALPSTNDRTALTSLMDTLRQEYSQYSSGSSMDRPVSTLQMEIKKSAAKHPERERYLIVLSDGETTSSDRQTELSKWSLLKNNVKGALVLGYGTNSGGKMRVREAGGISDSYIRDRKRPGNPPAVSRINEDALKEISAQLHADYIHSPSDDAVSAWSENAMKNAKTIAAENELALSRRYILWPPALLVAGLFAWEGAALVFRVKNLRRTHAL